MAYPEPNDRWKAQLKSRIDENLQKLLLDAKASYEQSLSETHPEDSFTRRKLYHEYLQTTDNLKTFAADEYKFALEREKQEIEWCTRAQVSDEYAELEALKEEQFAILHAIRMGTTRTTMSPTPTTAATPQPSPQPSPQPLETAHGDPYGFHDFASLSPLFTPTHLDAVSECAEYESETTDSRTPSPSPPSTPPRSTSNASACVESPFFQVPRIILDEEARLRAERQAQQQAEFHKRAEDIRRRNQEKAQQKQQEQQTQLVNYPKWEAPPSESSATSSSASSYYSSGASSSDEETRYNSATPTFSSASSSASSAPTSTPSSSCNSPHFPTSSPCLSDPYVIAPMCEEDTIRLFVFHDQQWSRIASYHSLQWSDFPWPVLNFMGPRSDRELTMTAISDYILSAFDWEHDRVRSKEQLKEHIGKWHPERFDAKFLVHVPEARGERDRVRAGAGLVVKHLTELLGRFNELDA